MRERSDKLISEVRTPSCTPARPSTTRPPTSPHPSIPARHGATGGTSSCPKASESSAARRLRDTLAPRAPARWPRRELPSKTQQPEFIQLNRFKKAELSAVQYVSIAFLRSRFHCAWYIMIMMSRSWVVQLAARWCARRTLPPRRHLVAAKRASPSSDVADNSRQGVNAINDALKRFVPARQQHGFACPIATVADSVLQHTTTLSKSVTRERRWPTASAASTTPVQACSTKKRSTKLSEFNMDARGW